MSFRSFDKTELESPDAPLCVQSEHDILSNPSRIVRCGLVEVCLKKLEQLGCHPDHENQVKNEKEFYFKVNKYLDIDFDDEILFLDLAPDDIYSYWPYVVENKFCLTNPLEVCHLRLDKKENEYRLMRVKDKKLVSREKMYDKIIVKNCMKYFQNRERDFCEFLLSLLKHQTQHKSSILIIQRVSDLNTLPYSTSIASEWLENDVAYTKFMEALQKLYFTLNYDIEVFKTFMPCKSSWFRQLAESTTYPLNPRGLIVDASMPQRRLDDVRELNEGLFKYHPFDECVEITDRMLFIGTHRPLNREAFLEEMKRNFKRIGPKADKELDKEIKTLYMEITPDIKDLIKK